MMSTKKFYHQTVDKKCKVPHIFCQHLQLDMNITVGSHSYHITFGWNWATFFMTMLLPVTSDLNVTCENQRLGQKQNFPHIGAATQIHTFVANCLAATVLDGEDAPMMNKTETTTPDMVMSDTVTVLLDIFFLEVREVVYKVIFIIILCFKCDHFLWYI